MGTNDPLEPTPGMQIARETIALSTLEEMAEGMFGTLVKAVVDVEQGITAVVRRRLAAAQSLGDQPLPGPVRHEKSRQGRLTCAYPPRRLRATR